jgi:multiple sugar transport system substrate-binding protein
MRKKVLLAWPLIFALLLPACAVPAAAPSGEGAEAPDEEAAPAEGVASDITIDVLTFTGPQIAGPMQRRGAEFAEKTGIQVNVTVVPFSDLYQKMLSDLSTGTNAFDVYVFAPQWMVDYIEPGYLLDITDWVAANEELQWEDIAPLLSRF